MDKPRDLRDTLKDQVEDKAGNADLEKTLAALSANREKIREEGRKFRTQKEAVFTPEQRAKMVLAFSGNRFPRGTGTTTGNGAAAMGMNTAMETTETKADAERNG